VVELLIALAQKEVLKLSVEKFVEVEVVLLPQCVGLVVVHCREVVFLPQNLVHVVVGVVLLLQCVVFYVVIEEVVYIIVGIKFIKCPYQSRVIPLQIASFFCKATVKESSPFDAIDSRDLQSLNLVVISLEITHVQTTKNTTDLVP
jgi:hypothetical protein